MADFMPVKHLPRAIDRPVVLTKDGKIKPYESHTTIPVTGERVRKSHGKAKDTEFATWSKSSSTRTGTGVQTPATLRDIWKKTSSVRWCVDVISRELSNLPWAIVPNYSDSDVSSDTIEHIILATKFLQDPNINEESLSELINKFVTDMLVLDRGIIEKTFGIGKTMVELWARDGATFHPITDSHGVLLGYKQVCADRDSVDFTRREIVFLRLCPTSYSKYGMPIIESIINEIGALLFSIGWIADSFTEDEIPPGILVLGKIGQEAYERSKADFKQSKGIGGKGDMRVIDNVEDVKWIEFKKTNTEMQLMELSERLDRIIYRNFDIEYDIAGKDLTGLNMQEKFTKLRLLKPLARLIAWKFNKEIISEFGFEDVRFQFIIRDMISDSSRAIASKNYILTGQRSLNEERAKDGFPPIDGGDRKFILVGKRIIFVDTMNKMVSENLEEGVRAPDESTKPAREGATEEDNTQEQAETPRE